MQENGNYPSLRTIRVAETDRHFFVAVKSPFDIASDEFEYLDLPAESVHDLPEGSQVFIYDRKAFGADSDTQYDGVLEHVSAVAEEIGGIAIYPNIQLLSTGKDKTNAQ